VFSWVSVLCVLFYSSSIDFFSFSGYCTYLFWHCMKSARSIGIRNARPQKQKQKNKQNCATLVEVKHRIYLVRTIRTRITSPNNVKSGLNCVYIHMPLVALVWPILKCSGWDIRLWLLTATLPDILRNLFWDLAKQQLAWRSIFVNWKIVVLLVVAVWYSRQAKGKHRSIFYLGVLLCVDWGICSADPNVCIVRQEAVLLACLRSSTYTAI